MAGRRILSITSAFSLAAADEVFFTSTSISRAVRAAVATGDLRQVGPRLYARAGPDPVERVVARHRWAILAGYLPGAVVVDATAFTLAPSADGSLCVAAGTHRTIELPGLRLRARRGHGPVVGDTPFMDGLFLASEARRFLENLRDARARGGFRWTLAEPQLLERLDRVAAVRGADGLCALREDARQVSAELGTSKELTRLEALIARRLRPGPAGAHPRRDVPAPRIEGLPCDPARVELFDVLLAALAARPVPSRAASPSTGTPQFAAAEQRLSARVPETEPAAGPVQPGLVRGTLRQGHKRYAALPPGFARAAFQAFLLSEVRPLPEGNDRVARMRMNAELTAVGEQRIIITAHHRDAYMDGLRALSSAGDPEPFIAALDTAQATTAAIDWAADAQAGLETLRPTAPRARPSRGDGSPPPAPER